MRKVTKRLITSDEDLVDFGLHLGFEQDEITQVRTNNPHSIENAAWNLACRWWKVSTDDIHIKLNKLQTSVEVLGKFNLREEIKCMIREWQEKRRTEETGFNGNEAWGGERALEIQRQENIPTNLFHKITGYVCNVMKTIYFWYILFWALYCSVWLIEIIEPIFHENEANETVEFSAH